MFRLFNNIQNELFAVVTDKTGPIQDKELGHEDVIEFLGEEEETEKLDLKDAPKVKDKKEESKEEEKETISDEKQEEPEIDELKELEQELEEPSEEQLELMTPVRRAEILKKYPQVFKDFPYLERAYYREQQFTELLPTINDAKIAVEKSKVLDDFERELLTGSTEKVLKAVKEDNQQAFNKIVDNYLPTLAKVDPAAYNHVLSNITSHTVQVMAQEAKRTNNEELLKAAALLNQFVFGTSEFVPPKQLTTNQNTKDDTKDTEISQREEAFYKQQFEAARDDLNGRLNNTLKSTIDAHIDPKNSMTDYVKRTATREVLDKTVELIGKDSRLKILIQRLWDEAARNNYRKDSVDKIRSAYLSKAKILLPAVIKQARNEALKGMGKRVKDEEPEEQETSSREAKDKPKSQSSSKGNNKEIPAGMKTLDYLMQD